MKTSHLRKDRFDLQVFWRLSPRKEARSGELTQDGENSGDTLVTLCKVGHSIRIAETLQVDPETVRRYLRQQSCGPKLPNVPTGSEGSKPPGLPSVPAGESKPANAPTGSPGEPPECPAANVPFVPGPASQCVPYRELIAAKLVENLSYQRIQQDLADAGITVHYDSLRRFCRRLVRRRALPVRRIEREPGDEAQVDFGSGMPIISPDGKRRKTYVFRIVLSHSRKGYSEATFTQTTDDFLRALENGFRQLGGVTKTLVIDNLKAAVAHPDWFDPELVPKVQSFCQHYGTVILPTKPYTPQHKGKVEAGVKYVKNNGLKGRTFTSLAEVAVSTRRMTFDLLPAVERVFRLMTASMSSNAPLRRRSPCRRRNHRRRCGHGLQ